MSYLNRLPRLAQMLAPTDNGGFDEVDDGGVLDDGSSITTGAVPQHVRTRGDAAPRRTSPLWLRPRHRRIGAPPRSLA
jgi:hypothetical protein